MDSSSNRPFVIERDERAAFAARLNAIVGTTETKTAPKEGASLPQVFSGKQAESVKEPVPARRACAQLTFSFKITALQLTPFFKLGSVQVEAISNVVSLRLVTAHAPENSLVAGVSFQIESAELDEARTLQVLRLRPLEGLCAVEAPSSGLRVDAIAILGNSENAPVSITADGQTPTVLQLTGDFTITAMDFTPAFEIDTLRVKPVSNTVSVHVDPSAHPVVFSAAAVRCDDGGQIQGMRLHPIGSR